MKKIDSTVKKESLYIAIWVVILSAIMEAVFLIIGKWDYTVILGNLLAGVISILNFFLMALTIQSAVNKEDKSAKATMKLSQMLRMLMILVALILGVVLPCFNMWASIIPFFFPRIAITFRGIKKDEKEKKDNNNNTDDTETPTPNEIDSGGEVSE